MDRMGQKHPGVTKSAIGFAQEVGLRVSEWKQERLRLRLAASCPSLFTIVSRNGRYPQRSLAERDCVPFYGISRSSFACHVAHGTFWRG